MPIEQGPYLKAALFCESVIEEKDGVLSFIRVIDRLTTTAVGPEAPADMPTIRRQMKAVLMLVSGRATGREDVKLEVEEPSGTKRQLWAGTIQMEGNDRGQNLILDFGMEFKDEGLYWFDVLVGDQPLTRMPFRIIYARLSHGAPRQ